ncbi:3340_t:CDS:2 [Ambispora gerdemannii]|uniref:3340_t:CDS:1 n=1 Tax=Ambispora gerdemannii TaxID=144530 RepID=A0A9N8V512_9GLOM|nr:3340_t:CDS:2 [Ambispora gerdemannii]
MAQSTFGCCTQFNFHDIGIDELKMWVNITDQRWNLNLNTENAELLVGICDQSQYNDQSLSDLAEFTRFELYLRNYWVVSVGESNYLAFRRSKNETILPNWKSIFGIYPDYHNEYFVTTDYQTSFNSAVNFNGTYAYISLTLRSTEVEVLHEIKEKTYTRWNCDFWDDSLYYNVW